MPRVSQAVAQEHRAKMVGAAARLLRERGPEGVTVVAVTEAAGLTQGTFYKQFASKEALLAEACTAAAQSRKQDLATVEAANEGCPASAWRTIVDGYLSETHRDAPGAGCPVSSLAAAAARTDDPAFRHAYRQAVNDLLDALESTGGRGRRQALLEVIQLVGAITVARAIADNPLSEEVLTAARSALG